ncbi:MAG: PilZ domain-containing protein, partial [Pirellulaceae bacterium]
HEAQPDAECRLLLKLVDSHGEYVGYLADLSRQGLKAATEGELPTDELVRIEAELPDGRLLLSPRATVRWAKIQDNGQWTAGLQFDQELPWEVMGELFLSGVLSRDVTCSLRMPDRV